MRDTSEVIAEMERVSCDGGLTMARLNDWIMRLRQAAAEPADAGRDARELLIDCRMAIDSIPRESTAKDVLLGRIDAAIGCRCICHGMRDGMVHAAQCCASPKARTSQQAVKP